MKCPFKNKFKVTQEYKGAAHDGLDIVGITSKNVYSTVNGLVEVASWENSNDKKQGFGQYVRIKKEGTSDRYYFGHLSKIAVRVGQEVKTGDLLGTEGNTGYSFGSHLHYCVREGGKKANFKDISKISGIPNKIGVYENNATSEKKKSVSEIANEVIKGLWGTGNERREKLKSAGYDYSSVQQKVNELVLKEKKPTPKKTTTQIANEVIKGLWGNGSVRKKKLIDAGYNYQKIQAKVNELLKG